MGVFLCIWLLSLFFLSTEALSTLVLLCETECPVALQWSTHWLVWSGWSGQVGVVRFMCSFKLFLSGRLVSPIPRAPVS